MMIKRAYDTVFGFTMIELLIVLIIIGIMAVILLPMFSTMPERARLAEAKTVIDSMRTLLVLEHIKSGGFPPTPANTTTETTFTGSGMSLPEESLFNYTYVTAISRNECTIYAERNTNAWGGENPGRHWNIKLAIYHSGGSEDFEYLAINSTIPSSSGPTRIGW